jgi:pimeloyl-ACP methyl ester carboxylesterase
VRRLVNLEGFGMPATVAEQAPARFAQWMNELKQLRQGTLTFKSYDSLQGVAQRLMKTNPRLQADKAAWLAQHWAAETAPGQWQILGEAAHKISNAQLYRLEEVLAVYRCIQAPLLMVEAADDSMQQWWGKKFTRAQHRERLQSVASVEIAVVENAGHMLHHDQPQQVAAQIERFLQDS